MTLDRQPTVTLHQAAIVQDPESQVRIICRQRAAVGERIAVKSQRLGGKHFARVPVGQRVFYREGQRVGLNHTAVSQHCAREI